MHSPVNPTLYSVVKNDRSGASQKKPSKPHFCFSPLSDKKTILRQSGRNTFSIIGLTVSFHIILTHWECC